MDSFHICGTVVEMDFGPSDLALKISDTVLGGIMKGF